MNDAEIASYIGTRVIVHRNDGGPIALGYLQKSKLGGYESLSSPSHLQLEAIHEPLDLFVIDQLEPVTVEQEQALRASCICTDRDEEFMAWVTCPLHRPTET